LANSPTIILDIEAPYVVEQPDRFGISQNYPNPFNPRTQIRFDLPQLSDNTFNVRVTIYNIKGQLLQVLLDERRSAGSYVIQWNGKNDAGYQVPSGLYFYRISTVDWVVTKKMLLQK